MFILKQKESEKEVKITVSIFQEEQEVYEISVVKPVSIIRVHQDNV